MLRMAVSEREEREKGTEEIFETIRTENVPQIYVRHQITDPGSLQNANRLNAKNMHLSIYFSKSKRKKNLERSRKKTTTLAIKKQR